MGRGGAERGAYLPLAACFAPLAASSARVCRAPPLRQAPFSRSCHASVTSLSCPCHASVTSYLVRGTSLSRPCHVQSRAFHVPVSSVPQLAATRGLCLLSAPTRRRAGASAGARARGGGRGGGGQLDGDAQDGGRAGPAGEVRQPTRTGPPPARMGPPRSGGEAAGEDVDPIGTGGREGG